MNMGYYWAHSMVQWEHDLKVWFVSRRGTEALGQKIYHSLDEVPEKIDYAIIAVPWKYVPGVIQECVQKGAKCATIFTSGFAELEDDEGIQREQELKELIHSLPIRVLGPNCMGLTNPKLGFAFMPTAKRLAGDVGFISQSGGVAIATYTAGVASGVGFSKLFSFGNQIDISSTEILSYFEFDDETKVVGAYIEGTKNGKEFFEALKSLAAKKPVVVLKGGRSLAGSRAAASHTGALAGSRDIWNTAFKQANVTTVETLEDMVATLSLFSLSPAPRSRDLGLIAISGGTSVIYTDLCLDMGLGVPSTSPETVKKLDPLIKDVGTGLGNPIDMAADYYHDQTVGEVIRIAGEDPNFGSLIIEADVHNIHQVSTIMDAADVVDGFWNVMADAAKGVVEKEKKPVLIAVPEVAYPEARNLAWNIFIDRGLPVFRNFREAAGALKRVSIFHEIQDRRNS